MANYIMQRFIGRWMLGAALRRGFAGAAELPWKQVVREIIQRGAKANASLESLKKLANDSPKDVHLQGRYVGMLYRYKMYMDMPEFMDKIKAADPESLLPLYFKALVNLDMKLLKEAQTYATQADASKKPLKPIEMLYKAMVLSRFGRKLDALKLLNAYLASEEGKGDLEALMEKLQIELERNNYQDVLVACNDHLAKDKKNIQMRFYRGIAMRGLNELQQAIVEFTTLLEETDDDKLKALIYVERSKCRNVKDLEQQVADLNMAQTLCPQLCADKLVLIAYYTANRLDVVEEMIGKLEKKYNFKNDYVMLLIKGAVTRYQKQDYAAALPIYRRVWELAPQQAKAHFEKQVSILEMKAGKKPTEPQKPTPSAK